MLYSHYKRNITALCLCFLSIILSACGGGGGSSNNSSAGINPLGTWSANTAQGNTVYLEFTPYAYSIYEEDPSTNIVCMEFGTWSSTSSAVSFSPDAASTCNATSTYQENTTLSGNSLTLSTSTHTGSWQLQTSNPLSSATGNWLMAERILNGQTSDVKAQNFTLNLSSTTYQYTQPSPACNETGGWTFSANTISLTPTNSSTCGNTTPYTQNGYVNGPLLILHQNNETDIFTLISSSTSSTSSTSLNLKSLNSFPSSSTNFTGVAASSANAVLAGSSGYTFFSADSNHWYSVQGVCPSINGVFWIGNFKKFVLLCSNKNFYTHADDTGSTPWTNIGTGGTYYAAAGASTPGNLVFVGLNGNIAESTDFSNWINPASGTSNSLRTVIWDGTQYVAGGDTG